MPAAPLARNPPHSQAAARISTTIANRATNGGTTNNTTASTDNAIRAVRILCFSISRHLVVGIAETSLAFRKILERLLKLRLTKVRPEAAGEPHFRVSKIPEQKVT